MGSVEPEVSSGPAPDVDPGLPLVELDARLAPLRRVVAWAVGHPDGVRFFEANAGRWLDPVLASDLPDPIRELVLAAAGQITGFDAADADARRLRLERLRQVLMRLDAVLGLPLPARERSRRPPRRERPSRKDRPRPERAAADPSPEEASDVPDVPDAPPARDAAPMEDGDLLDLDLDLDGLLEVDDDGEDGEDDAPAGPRRTGRWTGNPHAALGSLDIDEALVTALEAAGLSTVGSLLERAPVEEEILRPVHGAGRELPEGRVAVGGRLAYRWTVCGPGGTQRTEATLHGAGPLRLAWSPGSPSAWWPDLVGNGDRVVVAGTFDGHVLREPELVFDDGKAVRKPQYRIPGVDDGRVQALLYRLLPHAGGVRDPVPPAVRGRHLALSDALIGLHGRGDAEAARARMAFDEALVVALGTGWSRLGAQRVRGIPQTVVHGRGDRLLGALGVRLDDAQERAFDDIRRDLRHSRPMRRVLTGAPGGGKSLVALLATVMVAEAKNQVLWVCSDARMADLRFTYMEPLLREVGLTARLASESPNGGVRDAVKRGDVHVLFGTDALLALPEPLEFRRLGLVVSAERARLGRVSQLVDELKAPRPDLLVLPASLPSAEVLLGAWSTHDISMLPGPPAPEVVIKQASQRDAAYAPARHALASGGQVAVLFPQIGGADALDPSEARRVVSALEADALAGARIALLHGSMGREERVRVMEDLSHRRADVVVATGPLEDGPPVPGIRVAVVEHAHRMDPLRLSRVPGLGPSQVVLVVADETPEVQTDALRAVVRGDRAVPGPAEPGPPLPTFRFLDLQADGDVLLDARAAALSILAADPGLRNGAHADLLRSAHARWEGLVGGPCPLPDPGESSVPKRRRKRRRRR